MEVELRSHRHLSSILYSGRQEDSPVRSRRGTVVIDTSGSSRGGEAGFSYDTVRPLKPINLPAEGALAVRLRRYIIHHLRRRLHE